MYLCRVAHANLLWMRSDVMLFLVATWTLLLLKRMQREEEMAGHQLVSHLQFFQTQLLGEAILFAAGSRTRHVRAYTRITSAYRAIPLAHWLLHGLRVVLGIQSSLSIKVDMDYWDPTDWMIFLVLPVMTTVMWLQKTLACVPREFSVTTTLEDLKNCFLAEKQPKSLSNEQNEQQYQPESQRQQS